MATPMIPDPLPNVQKSSKPLWPTPSIIHSRLGPLLESLGGLKRLGEDGCLPPAQPVDLGFPIIRHAVVAQLRFWFGDDASPMGLDTDVADQYELAIDIDSKD